tara:strand:+ start:209 stop:367 length:159 start_codon:yes stop_codon:yes gene_type:complete
LHASKSHEVEDGIEVEEEEEEEVVVLAVASNNRSLILEILIPCFVSSSIVPA